MTQTLGNITFLVREYDEAIRFFTEVMGFTLTADIAQGEEKRWVVVTPPGSTGTSLLLARAANPEQESRIGNQTGGRVFLFLHTDDFQRDHRRLLENGVKFLEEPREEPYATVAVFEDLYGNKWDLLRPRGDSE